MAATTKKQLIISNVRAVPNNIPAPGGSVVVKYDLVTKGGDPNTSTPATVKCAIPVVFGYSITSGDTTTQTVTNTKKTFSQPIKVKRVSGSAEFFKVEVRAKIAGDPEQKGSCVVHITQILAANVKSLRSNEGLTQVALAEKLGIAPSTLGKIERGKGASNPVVEKVVEFLNA